jgi:hypothetical protein
VPTKGRSGQPSRLRFRKKLFRAQPSRLLKTFLLQPVNTGFFICLYKLSGTQSRTAEADSRAAGMEQIP